MAGRRTTERVQFFNDFTGGLNLRTQRQDLALNESPDCLDIDFNSRGGIASRRGYRNVTQDTNMGTTLTAGFPSSGYLVGTFSAGTEVLWGVSSAGRLWTWDGATATHVATAITSNTTSEFVHGAIYKDKLYFANAYNGGTTLIMRYWNGTAFTTLTNTPNNNYTAPTGGNAPLARLACDHGGYMWWADTVESGTRFRSRLRWSHPLQPEDFAAADYFDIEADDQTDQITALYQFRGQLFVFKKRSVYAIYGSSRDDFIPEKISATAGAWSQEGVTASQSHLYWWSPDGDVWSYDGREVVSVGNKISLLADNGTIIPGADHRLCWAENRLWVSFLTAANTNRLTYVMDPRIGGGAWTKYSVPITSMVWWRRNSGVNGIMIRVLGYNGVADFNIPTQEVDRPVSTDIPIQAYYISSWFFGRDTALTKRWKRMHITSSADDPATMNVDVYFDFNESLVVKTMQAPIDGAAGLYLWNGGTWNGGVWNGSDSIYSFDRMQSSGRSHAVRFKFYVTNHLAGWSMDSYALPYIEKGYR